MSCRANRWPRAKAKTRTSPRFGPSGGARPLDRAGAISYKPRPCADGRSPVGGTGRAQQICLEAQVAQLVEQRTENPRVGGSNPPLGTTPCNACRSSSPGTGFRLIPVAAVAEPRVRISTQRLFVPVLLRLRVAAVLRAYPIRATKRGSVIPGRCLHDEARFLDCCIGSCDRFHGAIIRRRRTKDEVSLHEGPHEVGRFHQDLLVG